MRKNKNKGSHMRGFIVTILSIGLIVLLATLALSFRNAQFSMERALLEPLPLLYSASAIDAVSTQFNSLVGPGLSITQQNLSTQIWISDSLHGFNHSGEINSFSSFLNGELSARTGSNISANFTNLTSGTIRLFINEDYEYLNNHETNGLVFTRAGGTQASIYEINITTSGVRTNSTQMAFDPAGTLNVTITHTDLNGTVVEQGAVNPGSASSLSVDFEGGGRLEIEIGPHSSNPGSLKIDSTGIGSVVSLSATLPPINESKKLGYEYDATIEYVQGNSAKRCRIGK